MTTPSLLLLSLNMTEAGLWSGVAKKMELYLASDLYNILQYLPRKRRLKAFLILPSFVLQTLNSKEIQSRGREFPSSIELSLSGWRLYLGKAYINKYSLCLTLFMAQRFLAGQPRKSEVTLLSQHFVHKAKQSLQDKWPTVLSPIPLEMAEILPMERGRRESFKTLLR